MRQTPESSMARPPDPGYQQPSKETDRCEPTPNTKMKKQSQSRRSRSIAGTPYLHRFGCRPERVERVEGPPLRMQKSPKQTQKQDGESAMPSGSCLSTHPRIHAASASPRCLDPLTPWCLPFMQNIEDADASGNPLSR